MSASFTVDFAAIDAHGSIGQNEGNSVQSPVGNPGGGLPDHDLSDDRFGTASPPGDPQANPAPLETGWVSADVDAWGNHGYTLDPTFIPTYSLETINNEGIQEAYAYLDSRTYISTRHQQDSSNAVWLDGHVSRITPREVYQDNRHWNGLGREDPQRDGHVDDRVANGVFRFANHIE